MLFQMLSIFPPCIFKLNKFEIKRKRRLPELCEPLSPREPGDCACVFRHKTEPPAQQSLCQGRPDYPFTWESVLEVATFWVLCFNEDATFINIKDRLDSQPGKAEGFRQPALCWAGDWVMWESSRVFSTKIIRSPSPRAIWPCQEQLQVTSPSPYYCI